MKNGTEQGRDLSKKVARGREGTKEGGNEAGEGESCGGRGVAMGGGGEHTGVTLSSNASPRILVLSASVGAGHMRAAQAVEPALRELAAGAGGPRIDEVTLTNAGVPKVDGQ